MIKLYTYSNFNTCSKYIYQLETDLYNEEMYGDNVSDYKSVESMIKEIKNKYLNMLANLSIKYSILFKNDNPIGYITYGKETNTYNNTGIIISLFIHNDYRGMKLSRLLMETAHEYFNNNSCLEAVVHILKDRQDIIGSFYNKFNYYFEKEVDSQGKNIKLLVYRNNDIRRNI